MLVIGKIRRINFGPVNKTFLIVGKCYFYNYFNLKPLMILIIIKGYLSGSKLKVKVNSKKNPENVKLK